MNSRPYWEQINATKGGRLKQGVNIPVLTSLEIPLPPLPEQKAIAEVLRTVQRAQEATEKVIAATRQLKASLMKHLFTYGPVPFDQADQVPLKETEVGLIPEHWILTKCEDVCDLITVGVVVRPSEYYVKSGVPAFRSFNIREDRLETKDLVFFSEADNNGPLRKSRLKQDDVLVVRTGYPGTSCVVPKKYDGANCIDLVIVRPSHSLIKSEFLSRYFNSFEGRNQALRAKTGLAQQHLNVGAVKETLIPLPPLEEQHVITEQLQIVDGKLRSEESQRRSLSTLFESLLSGLMTGQLRVGDHVCH